MALFSLRSLLGLALSVGLVACGSSSSSDSSASPGAEKFANELAGIVCAADAKCCTAQGDTQDPATCRQLLAKVELQRGELFDPDVADQCLKALDGYTCDGDYPTACLQVFYGKTPVGQPCKFGTDCARPDGAMTNCVMDDLDHWTCKLIETAAAGDPCGVSSVTPTDMHLCADGLSCSGTCQAELPVGSDCQGAVCQDGSSCEWDASASANRCTAYQAVGEDCSSRACVDSAYCGTDKLCHAKKNVGEACAADQECLDICHPTTHLCAANDFYCW
jgi:hypothetical protein